MAAQVIQLLTYAPDGTASVRQWRSCPHVTEALADEFTKVLGPPEEYIAGLAADGTVMTIGGTTDGE